jgi:hypothetical protein
MHSCFSMQTVVRLTLRLLRFDETSSSSAARQGTFFRHPIICSVLLRMNQSLQASDDSFMKTYGQRIFVAFGYIFCFDIPASYDDTWWPTQPTMSAEIGSVPCSANARCPRPARKHDPLIERPRIKPGMNGTMVRVF